MKNMKRILALLIAVLMIATMVPAFAAGTTDGTITINSPVVGTIYKAYQIFDLKMDDNDNPSVFSYTIKGDSKVFAAVKAYANEADATDKDGLTLTVTADTKDAADKDKVYIVTVSESFDPQVFGTAIRNAIDQMDAEAKPTAYESNATGTDHIVTEADTSRISFTELPFGYYLINATYPEAAVGTVTMTVKDYSGTESTEAEDKYTFTNSDLDANKKLTVEAKAKVTQYVGKTVTNAYVDAYIADKGIKHDDGTALTDDEKYNEGNSNSIKAQLIASMQADAIAKIENAFANQFAGSESDLNYVKQPILVFVDSTVPQAVINEKNELNKWDVPVNPSGDGEPEDLPDHGEPEGGKNIVIHENPAYYADWTEANIGDSIHYQLRVNAMNFVREVASGDGNTQSTANKVEQVKAYNLLDYQSAQMHFDSAKKLRVTIVDGNGNNVTNADTAVNPKYIGTSDTVTSNGETVTFEKYYDYTSLAESKFFVNDSTNPNKDGSYSVPNGDIFTDGNSNGIVVPWVKISKEDLSATYPVYTTNYIPKVDGSGAPVYKHEDVKVDSDNNKVQVVNANNEPVEGQYVSVNGHIVDANGNLLDATGNKIQDTEPVYIYSLYNSDVTIVVDYWMILDDDAIVDEPGNKNFAQYGYSKVEREDENGKPVTPTTPNDDTEPDEKKEVDEATVYTYALAWVKVNNKGEALDGAKFQLPFYVKATKDTGSDSYVYAMTNAEYEASTDADKETKYTNVLTTTATGVITIKGVKAGKYSITETEAPEGYNKLTEPFELEAKKTGESITKKTETTIKLDKDGNITDQTAVTTVTFNTDKDTQVAHVPVYEFDPVINRQGTELPSTGGMGTTLFYIGGGILVVLAIVMLVTKRRMSSND